MHARYTALCVVWGPIDIVQHCIMAMLFQHVKPSVYVKGSYIIFTGIYSEKQLWFYVYVFHVFNSSHILVGDNVSVLINE